MSCKWKLAWEDDCNAELYSGLAESISEIEAEDIVFAVIEPENLSETTENARGAIVTKFSKTRSRYQSSWVLTPDQYENFQYVDQFKTVTLTKTEFNETPVEMNIDPTSIQLQANGDPSDSEREVIMTFALLDSWSTNGNCCDSAYENSPYGVIGNGGGVPDPENEPDACSGWSAIIDDTNFPDTLGIFESGTPSGTSNVFWYLNGNQVGTGTSIALGEYGVYSMKIIRVADGETEQCIRTDEFSYLDKCRLFDIQVGVNGSTILANILNAPEADAGTWEVLDDTNSVVATSLPYTPQDPQTSGVYTVKYISDTCGEKMKSVFVTIEDNSTAQHSVEVIHQSGALHCNVLNAPVGTQTFVWTKIDINGTETAVGTNSADYQPTETAIYRCTVSIGGNGASDQKLWKSAGLEVRITNTVTEPVITSELNELEPVITTYSGSGGSERLDLSGSGRELPHPSVFNTQAAMMGKIMVNVNSVLYTYNHAGYDNTDFTYDESQLGQNQFGIDWANDQIVFEETLLTNKKIVVVQL